MTELNEGERGAALGAGDWLLDVAEYEATMFELEQLRAHLARRSALDVAIDKATGYEDQLADEAQELMARASEIRTRLEPSA